MDPSTAPMKSAACNTDNSSSLNVSHSSHVDSSAHTIDPRAANGYPTASPTVKHANDTDAVAAHVRQVFGIIPWTKSVVDGTGTLERVDAIFDSPRSISLNDANASLVSLTYPFLTRALHSRPRQRLAVIATIAIALVGIHILFFNTIRRPRPSPSIVVCAPVPPRRSPLASVLFQQPLPFAVPSVPSSSTAEHRREHPAEHPTTALRPR
jgi:hypothetical protein